MEKAIAEDAQQLFNEMKSATIHAYTMGYERRYSERDADPEPRSVRVKHLYAEQYDGNWPPENAAGFIAWFQERLSEIPEQWRDSATIEIDTTTSYDSTYATIEIHYRRLESAEEIATRQAGWKNQSAADEARQRSEYEALKTKFETR